AAVRVPSTAAGPAVRATEPTALPVAGDGHGRAGRGLAPVRSDQPGGSVRRTARRDGRPTGTGSGGRHGPDRRATGPTLVPRGPNPLFATPPPPAQPGPPPPP